jgi:hypothetical protein
VLSRVSSTDQRAEVGAGRLPVMTSETTLSRPTHESQLVEIQP